MRCVSPWLDVGATLVQTIILKSKATWGDALHVKHVLRRTNFQHPTVLAHIRIQSVRMKSLGSGLEIWDCGKAPHALEVNGGGSIWPGIPAVYLWLKLDPRNKKDGCISLMAQHVESFQQPCWMI